MNNKNTKNIDPSKTKIEVVDAEIKFFKRPIKDVLEDAKTIDPKTVAKEVLQWLIKNVEDYIDNHVYVFKLDLILDNESESVEAMEETKRLQDLYRAIPDDEDLMQLSPSERVLTVNNIVNNSKASEASIDSIESAVACRTELNKVTTKTFEAMRGCEQELKDLFKRLSYYYELKGVNEGKMLIQELNGHVDIINFEYEAFSVGVKVYGGLDKVVDNKPVAKGEKKIVKQYVIPEAFTVWIELAFSPKERPLALF